MITGADSVFVIASDPMPMVRDFLQRWSGRWPVMMVAVGEGAQFEAWPQALSRLGSDADEVLVVRDHQMDADWDEKGYLLDGDGEGPIAIFYGPYPRRATRVLAVEDPYDRAEDFIYEPYEITLIGHGLSIVTVVTPRAQDAFTDEVINSLQRYVIA